ncbi:hypothetical protein GCM10010515_59840 [Streptomyces fructofermentans]|uniref:Uncharacterized protein n=1 Tax=Streptomyces fructofermentans TaxID=152141 RepID=A0A918NNX2_9ACTN|nr:hypothetical protein GCM10010515_59840 [Streptomyces fructofermentans]
MATLGLKSRHQPKDSIQELHFRSRPPIVRDRPQQADQAALFNGLANTGQVAAEQVETGARRRMGGQRPRVRQQF